MAEESKIVGVLSSIEEAINSASSALDSMNEKALKGGLGFDVLVKSLESSTKALDGVVRAVGAFGSAMTFGIDFGLINKSMNGLAKVFSTVVGGALKLAGIFDATGKAIDSVTGFSRSLNASLFETVAKFNGSFISAKRFSDYIIESSQKFATAEFGFISPADRIAAVKGLEQAGIPLERMSDIVGSAAGQMDLLNTSFLHSSALGLDLNTYMEMLGNAMLTQGLNSQQAAEQMALFGDISEDTGLRVDKVARSLQGLAGRFSKLGLTANFGKPILQGFANSLNSMGLGFENAIDLSETLSSSLAKLTSDYATAYVTFQRGGLEMGGGQGALGAAIGLRAELLRAGETGEQGQAALQLAGALKDTIASFAGGQIITVEQAAENPALQQTFFTQTQLLKDLYGITEAAEQDRTLELLQQIETATVDGNIDLAESLGEDLQNVLSARDETLGYAEKTAKFTESTFAELQKLNKNIIEAFRLSGDEAARVISDLQTSALNDPTIRGAISDLNARSPEDMKFDFSQALENLKNSTSDGLSRLAEGLGEDLSTIGTEVAEALSSITLNVSNPSGDASLDGLAANFKLLADEISKYIKSRESSNLFGPG